jgi:hypothetical protein
MHTNMGSTAAHESRIMCLDRYENQRRASQKIFDMSKSNLMVKSHLAVVSLFLVVSSVKCYSYGSNGPDGGETEVSTANAVGNEEGEGTPGSGGSSNTCTTASSFCDQTRNEICVAGGDTRAIGHRYWSIECRDAMEESVCAQSPVCSGGTLAGQGDVPFLGGPYNMTDGTQCLLRLDSYDGEVSSRIPRMLGNLADALRAVRHSPGRIEVARRAPLGKALATHSRYLRLTSTALTGLPARLRV